MWCDWLVVSQVSRKLQEEKKKKKSSLCNCVCVCVRVLKTYLSLEKLAGGLFASFARSWTLPVDLSHEVVEDLHRNMNTSGFRSRCLQHAVTDMSHDATVHGAYTRSSWQKI